MKSSDSDILVTGVGVTSAIGQGKAAFISALLEGRHNFGILERPGRQTAESRFLGAEIPALSMPGSIPGHTLRTASFSAQVALITLSEAWDDAGLAGIDPQRIGLVVGGSNFQQRELVHTHETYRDRVHFVRPTYGIFFMDSDLCGLCTETFGIQGFAYTLGSASASGQVAVIQAARAVQSGLVDVCIAVGALMDISYWECQGFRSLGAMGSDRYAGDPSSACRPFDRDRDGFIYGESCGAVVLETTASAETRGARPHARFLSGAVAMDGNRNPNPAFEGEVKVIQDALQQARLSAEDIDYVNPHGTGSGIGDETELKALKHCGLDKARLNATKSITGHGLSAAGAVEIVATILQMKESRLHPTRNLDNPLEPSFNWVRDRAISHDINCALNLSMGFGGVNSAVCLQRM